MKYILIVATSLILLSGCDSNEEAKVSELVESIEYTKDHLQQLIVSSNARDEMWERVNEELGPDGATARMWQESINYCSNHDSENCEQLEVALKDLKATVSEHAEAMQSSIENFKE